MKKYIDADKLIKAIEDRGLDCSFALKMERLDILALIDELQQEQPETPSGAKVMTMCNQILLDWVKEGKTPEEREQREQAHIRFFELYDEYMEQPEVDLNREITHIWGKCAAESNDQIACLHIESFIEIARHFAEWGATHLNTRKEE